MLRLFATWVLRYAAHA